MTLTRQLFTGIIATFIVLLVGIEAIYLHSARSNLEKQLDSHANETATSLALSIGSRMQSLDPGLVNTIANPIFDRGHFEVIEVRGGDDAVIFTRRLGETEQVVPAWFAAALAFAPPVGQSLISAGWTQLGKVTVQVHPRYAHQQLWETGLATLTWLSALFALALVGMRFYLLGILKPLTWIEDAAVAIGNREFVSIDQEPRTRELQRVTHAINSLSSKIRDAIAQETARTERLRREAFEDPATGQLNRRGLENALGTALVKSAEVHSGALALFSLAGLTEVNRIAGLSKGNQTLKDLADRLNQPGIPAESTTGRWQGPTFGAFLPNVDMATARNWADQLCSEFSAGLHASGLPNDVNAFCGIGHFSVGSSSVGQLSQLAEAALAESAVRGSGVSVRAQETDATLTDMLAEIEGALAGNRVDLVFQKVASIPAGDIIQYEFMSKLTDSRGQGIAAGAFIPVASQHNLLPRLDLRVVELVLAVLSKRTDLPPTVSINVSDQSVIDKPFRTELTAILKANAHHAHRLIFEMTGTAAGKSPELIKGFSQDLRSLGSRLALDNFEMDRNAVAVVHEIMPAYVKLAPIFTRQIGERDDARFILEAMLRVFQPLEIPVIAQGVEDNAMVTVLTEMGVSAYQGWALGRPAPI